MRRLEMTGNFMDSCNWLVDLNTFIYDNQKEKASFTKCGYFVTGITFYCIYFLIKCINIHRIF